MLGPDVERDTVSAANELPGVFGFELPDGPWMQRLRDAHAHGDPGNSSDFEQIEEVARGGQGVVFRARQSSTGRMVALKRLIGGVLATPAARARFEREVEAVAALRHANIVSLLGVDLSDEEPLLVFEWIDGVRLDEWAKGARDARDARPNLAHRMGVFEHICNAVQHAHQRGVIHRDLKPANILVDAAGEPHVLDFGLAKVAGRGGGRHATVTRSEQFVGTPGYAPPEQLRGQRDEVDAKSDVYALGAVLYMLLTGSPPFSSCADLPALMQAACAAPPAPPSSLAKADRELDAIALKALAIEKSRRYPTVAALAEDVRRYRRGEPIEARRDNGLYLLRAALRRHRVPVALAAITAATAVVCSVALAVLYAGQSQALRQEQEARQRAERMLAFVDQTLETATRVGRGSDLPLRRAMLDEAAATAATHFADQPDLEASARLTLGGAYGALGLYGEAEEHLRTALAIRETKDKESLETAEARLRLAQLLCDVNHPADAEPLVQQVCETRSRRLGDTHPLLAEALNLQGMVRQYHHDYDGAVRLHRRALSIYEGASLGRSPQAAECYANLGCALTNAMQYGQAEPACRAALAIRREKMGDDSPSVAGSLIELAKVRFAQAAYGEAESLYREAIALNRRLLGDRHDNVAWGLHRLGVLLHALGRYPEARASLAESLDIYRTCYEDPLPYVPMVLESLGTMELDSGDLDAAELCFEEAKSLVRRGSNVTEELLRWRQNRLAELAEVRGDENAESLLRDAVAAGRELHKSHAAELQQLTRCELSLARLLVRKGASDEGELLARQALDRRSEAYGEDHPETGDAMVQLGLVLALAGRGEEARERVDRGLAIEKRFLSTSHPHLIAAQVLLDSLRATPP